MSRSVAAVVVLLLAGCSTAAEKPAPRPDPGGAVVRDLELRPSPRFVVRAGEATLGAGLEALGAFVGTAHADPVPAGEPARSSDEIEVDADLLSLDGQSGGTAILTGHVRLRRAGLTLACDRLTARSDPSGALVEARAEGSVRVEREGGLVATAAAARLDLARGELVLEGPVRLLRAEGTVEGARVVLALADGRVTVQRARGRLRLRSAGGAR